MEFPTDYSSILKRVDAIDPVAYSKTRNFADGAVTGLSPYISRGVISLPQVRNAILKKQKAFLAEKLLQELAWREYWQRVWESRGDDIFSDLKQSQQKVRNREIPAAIIEGRTGIEAIDEGIQALYQTGYMHNHMRMYLASLACNIAQSHWLQPARWLYYHLLDGDLASNSLSWQWVAGSFSSKKYYCNQENINKYFYSNQRFSYLDKSYDALVDMEIPDVLQSPAQFSPVTVLPDTGIPSINPELPTLLYNNYNLDPNWHSDVEANRVLLLEPAHFDLHPVSPVVMDFMLALSRNIPSIQVFVGSFEELLSLTKKGRIIFKKHPAFMHYKGVAENPDYLFPGVSGYFPSFFAYWKKCERSISGR